MGDGRSFGIRVDTEAKSQNENKEGTGTVKKSEADFSASIHNNRFAVNKTQGTYSIRDDIRLLVLI